MKNKNEQKKADRLKNRRFKINNIGQNIKATLCDVQEWIF